MPPISPGISGADLLDGVFGRTVKGHRGAGRFGFDLACYRLAPGDYGLRTVC